MHPLTAATTRALDALASDIVRDELALDAQSLTARATPARAHKPLRLRVCLSHDGPPWLSLLAQCAWLRGGIIGERVVPQPTS